jgi:hypothetical protein
VVSYATARRVGGEPAPCARPDRPRALEIACKAISWPCETKPATKPATARLGMRSRACGYEEMRSAVKPSRTTPSRLGQRRCIVCCAAGEGRSEVVVRGWRRWWRRYDGNARARFERTGGVLSS